jgi:hypothetical protein
MKVNGKKAKKMDLGDYT